MDGLWVSLVNYNTASPLLVQGGVFPWDVTLTAGYRPQTTWLPDRTASSLKRWAPWLAEMLLQRQLHSPSTSIMQKAPTPPCKRQALSSLPHNLFLSLPGFRPLTFPGVGGGPDSRSPESRKERGGEFQVSQLPLRLSIPSCECQPHRVGDRPSLTLDRHLFLNTASRAPHRRVRRKEQA